ncbi:MAG: TetR family transcriptional regulator [Mastigocladus sp. ERB_26_2]
MPYQQTVVQPLLKVLSVKAKHDKLHMRFIHASKVIVVTIIFVPARLHDQTIWQESPRRLHYHLRQQHRPWGMESIGMNISLKQLH